jgi:uncharacterized membrane protein YfcA
MAPLDTFIASQWHLFAAVVMIVAGLTHGTLGFGFPLISTPMLAMVTDIQTAVLASLFPNLAVNLVSILRGGKWRASIARHWPVAAYVLVGTVAGTRVLIVADPEPLKALLALMIIAYLQQARLRGFGGPWLARNPRTAGVAFGLLAGFLAGTVNVTVPPLVIYFMALGLDALAMTQVLNLCFLVGRSTQAITLGLSGHLGMATFVATAPLTVASLAALYAGLMIQSRIRPPAFQRMLRMVLWAMALILVVQVARHYLR